MLFRSFERVQQRTPADGVVGYVGRGADRAGGVIRRYMLQIGSIDIDDRVFGWQPVSFCLSLGSAETFTLTATPCGVLAVIFNRLYRGTHDFLLNPHVLGTWIFFSLSASPFLSRKPDNLLWITVASALYH